MRKSLCLIPLAVLALAACDNNHGGSGGPFGGGPFGSSSGGSSGGSSCSSSTGSLELSSFVLSLFNDCGATVAALATALPIDLTTVTLTDTPSVEATAYDALFASPPG